MYIQKLCRNVYVYVDWIGEGAGIHFTTFYKLIQGINYE
jgi:hypothetical protein